jgi:hypothetical protein
MNGAIRPSVTVSSQAASAITPTSTGGSTDRVHLMTPPARRRRAVRAGPR